MNTLRIRPLRSMEELALGVELQKETWGRRFNDIVSAALMLVAQKIGGIAAGAFNDDDDFIGMLFGLTGIRKDSRVHWSHMLAIKPAYQGRGIGRLMKLYQRERVRSLGIDRIYWTFDPLEARNAHFNVNVLGAEVDAYVIDMYGSGETSPLHRGIGTDRFVMRWEVGGADSADHNQELDRLLTWDGDEAAINIEDVPPAPTRVRPAPDPEIDNVRRIEIPPDIQGLKSTDPDEATAWRTATRAAFTHHLAEGRRVVGFARDLHTGNYHYILASA